MPAIVRRPAPPARSALRAAALAALLAAALAPGAAAVDDPPLPGTYRARPAPVLACGGFTGGCRVLLLEGSLDFALVGVPQPGQPAVPKIEGSDLALRGLDGAVSPFPAAGDVPLSALAGSDAGTHYVFESADGAAQTVRLELWPAGAESFLLRGVYDEGCCDRFRHEIGGTLFDLTALGGPEEALRLDDGRFRVFVDWNDGRGGSGAGVPVAFDDRSGHFWFFRSDNPELLVKLIDACEPFDRWWFFAAGLTDVEVEIEVFGPGLFQHKVYSRPAGDAFEPILDTDAFPCSEPVI
jgi:hypothetical protein